ncbi:amino acid ABC transporter substrate-binding protein [Ottowia sp. GY511]|nr:amino acid ABC transporter substrate-binding protein [Ottowia sp. GY511]
MALAAGAAQAQELDRIRAAGKIVVAHRESSFPFSYLDDNNRPVGYAMDICMHLVNAVRAQLKQPELPVEYLLVSSASRVPDIAARKASLECGSTTNTASRREQVDYTIPHFISSARFLVRKGAGIARIEDLAGKRVISTKGTTSLTEFRRRDKELSLNAKVLEADDHAAAFNAVVQGKADAFVMDDVLLFGQRALAAKPDDYEVVGKPLTIEPYAIMLAKNEPAFKALVGDEIRRLIRTGEMQRLYAKWFEAPVPPTGVNMQMPMSFLLRDSFKFPSERVGDLEE